MRRSGLLGGVAAGILALAASSPAQKPAAVQARAPAAAAPLSGAEASVKLRVKAYYADIQADKKAEAYEFVAPESRNYYFDMNYYTLVGVRVTGVEFSKDGSQATVSLFRSEKVPGFQQILDMPGKDIWEKVKGEWCLALRPPSDRATPFGVMHFPQKPSSQGQPSPQPGAMQRKVDPSQYEQSLKKMMEESGQMAHFEGKQKPADAAKGAKKSGDSTKEKSDPSIPHP